MTHLKPLPFYTNIDIISGKICPYCGKKSEHIHSSEIYGTDYGMMYACNSCGAYVGCHKDRPVESKGRLANAELRKFKRTVHQYFDPMWQAKMAKENISKKKARDAGYWWLATSLKIPLEFCHIGMFDIVTCKEALNLILPCHKKK